MFEGRDPIYLQIAESIRGDILAGTIAEGDQVMSTTQYATTYRINPATAAKAFGLLVDEGVLYKQRGVGMFVADGAGERLRSEGRARFFSDRFDPLVREAALLGLTPHDLITRLNTRHGTAQESDALAKEETP